MGRSIQDTKVDKSATERVYTVKKSTWDSLVSEGRVHELYPPGKGWTLKSSEPLGEDFRVTFSRPDRSELLD